MIDKIKLREKFGGEGSGNFVHEGRPGEVGGSRESGAFLDKGTYQSIPSRNETAWQSPGGKIRLKTSYLAGKLRGAIYCTPIGKEEVELRSFEESRTPDKSIRKFLKDELGIIW